MKKNVLLLVFEVQCDPTNNSKSTNNLILNYSIALAFSKTVPSHQEVVNSVIFLVISYKIF